MSESLPTLTPLQAAVLNSLAAGELAGHELRDALGKIGIKKSGPAFYQAMARLEEAEFIRGRYENEVIDGHVIKRRFYEITGNGARTLHDALQFYSRMNSLYLLPDYTCETICLPADALRFGNFISISGLCNE